MSISVAILTTDKREFEKDYANSTPTFGTAPEALLQGFVSLPKIEIHVVSCLQQPPVSSPEKLAENIWYHALQVPKIGWMRTGYQGCIRAVRKKLREIQPDIVHGQGTERDCSLSAVFSGFPNVLTIHGNMRCIAKTNQARPFSFEWLAARIEGFTLPKAEGVFCNSRHTEEQVRLLARRTWLVPNALRAKFFAPPGVVERRSPPVLLNIGSVGPNKSQNKVLEMAERLHRRNARFELQLIGRLDETEPYGTRFRELVNQGRNRGYVNYLGEKSEEELIMLMDSAAGIIHAPCEEAFGLVAAEALARNLRLFGFKVGGLRDIAGGVEAAELVEPGNFAALEEAVMEWLSAGSPKINGGMERMRERYHPDVIARRHLEIYHEVLSRRPSMALTASAC